MENLEDILQSIEIYHRSLLLWKYTFIQELATYKVQVESEANDEEIRQTIHRIQTAFVYGNQKLDRLGELASIALSISRDNR